MGEYKERGSSQRAGTIKKKNGRIGLMIASLHATDDCTFFADRQFKTLPLGFYRFYGSINHNVIQTKLANNLRLKTKREEMHLSRGSRLGVVTPRW